MLITGLALNSPRVFSVTPGDITTYGIGTKKATARSTMSATLANDSVAALRLMPLMMSPARASVGGGPRGLPDGDAVRRIVDDAGRRRLRTRPRQRLAERGAELCEGLVRRLAPDVVAGSAAPSGPHHGERGRGQRRSQPPQHAHDASRSSRRPTSTVNGRGKRRCPERDSTSVRSRGGALPN